MSAPQYGQPQAQYGQPKVVTVSAQPEQRPSFTLHIVLSCFVFWCCGCLFGLIAFILAMVANSQSAEGRVQEARPLGKASIGVSIAGIVIGIICTIIIIVVNVLLVKHVDDHYKG